MGLKISRIKIKSKFAIYNTNASGSSLAGSNMKNRKPLKSILLFAYTCWIKNKCMIYEVLCQICEIHGPCVKGFRSYGGANMTI